MSITAVILTKNEEVKIRRCLDSLKSWVDEIVIVDDLSSDKTTQIAKDEYQAKIVYNKLDGDFAKQRNLGAEAATSKWILQLDADEVIPLKTAEAIKDTLNNAQNFDGFCILRKDCVFDKPLNYRGSRAQLRIYKKGRGKNVGNIHEETIVDGHVGEINAFILHYNFASVKEVIEKNNFYTELESQAVVNKIDSVSFSMIKKKILYKSIKLFFKHYIKNKAYKDGAHGFLRACLNTLHPIILWLKVLERGIKEKRLKK